MSGKRLYGISVVLVLLVVALAGCNPGPQLSREERVADFDYLYNTMKENYPLFGVQERLHGTKWLDNYDRYVGKVRNAKTDIQFAKALGEILSELKQGHTGMLSADSYHLFVATFNEEYLGENYSLTGLAEMYGESGKEKFIESYRPWIEALRDETVKARYAQQGASPVSKPPDPGGNLIGGQPFSLANLRAVRQVCDENQLLLVLDASLLADDLYFIKRREEAGAALSIREITRQISSLCDIFYFSGRKLGCARGGGMSVRDERLFCQLRSLRVQSVGSSVVMV
ncbi:MAG: tryptophanase [Bacillota bacterium]|nr:MAG: tryptophanase [Bacillota bacterium]